MTLRRTTPTGKAATGASGLRLTARRVSRRKHLAMPVGAVVCLRKVVHRELGKREPDARAGVIGFVR